MGKVHKKNQLFTVLSLPYKDVVLNALNNITKLKLVQREHHIT